MSAQWSLCVCVCVCVCGWVGGWVWRACVRVCVQCSMLCHTVFHRQCTVVQWLFGASEVDCDLCRVVLLSLLGWFQKCPSICLPCWCTLQHLLMSQDAANEGKLLLHHPLTELPLGGVSCHTSCGITLPPLSFCVCLPLAFSPNTLPQ